MIDIVEIKSLILNDLIDKRAKKKIYNQTQKLRKKEKKRVMIEQIKKERAENSLLFD